MPENRRNRIVRRILRGLLVGAFSAALAVVLWSTGSLETLENRTWDWRVSYHAPRSEPSDRVGLILLDQYSLDWIETEYGLTWPWPREVWSYIVGFCTRAETAAVAVDVLFVDPSQYGVGDDEQLARAFEAEEDDVLAVFLSSQGGGGTVWPEGIPFPGLEPEGLAGWRELTEGRFTYPRAVFPQSEFARNSEILGTVQQRADSDGVYRRAPLFALFGDVPVPGLGLAAYMAGRERPTEAEFRGRSLILDGREIPLDDTGQLVLKFRGDEGMHRAYNAAEIIQSELQILQGLEPAVDPEELTGTYIFIGYSAPGLLDLRPSPLSPTTPGVEIHATLLDNILTGDTTRPMHPAGAVAVIILAALAVGVLGAAVSGALKSALFFVLVPPLPILAGFLLYLPGLWLPVVAVEFGVILSLIGSNVLGYATEGRERRFIKGAFSQYLSPTVIEQLITQPDRLKLGGERRELTIFFSDIQGFTTISEALSPEELTHLLNDYLSEMTDIIQEEGGTIDKYEGDAIIAFWNAPVPYEDHPVRGVRAALRCQSRLAELRPGFTERCGREIYMRIGINSGPAVVGNMGSKTRFDYTMLGDAVNLAARLEGINKQFGTYTMISGSTGERLAGAFPVRELSRVRVVGKNEPVTVYEPMMPEEYERRREILEGFARGLEDFYAGRFEEARRSLSPIATADPAAGKYLAKIEELLANPPDEWDGVWTMTSK
jgi:adenylate cyclase